MEVVDLAVPCSDQRFEVKDLPRTPSLAVISFPFSARAGRLGNLRLLYSSQSPSRGLISSPWSGAAASRNRRRRPLLRPPLGNLHFPLLTLSRRHPAKHGGRRAARDDEDISPRIYLREEELPFLLIWMSSLRPQLCRQNYNHCS